LPHLVGQWRLPDGPGRKYFFFEKKKQKTFDSVKRVSRLTGAAPKEVKVFWFFFSKKNCFLGTCRQSTSKNVGVNRASWQDTSPPSLNRWTAFSHEGI
jgi:hypothetical protein